MTRVLRSLIPFLFASSLVAQATLDNDAVVGMVKSRIPEDVIIAIISGQPGVYSISAAGMSVLRDGGVPEGIISTVIQKSGTKSCADQEPQVAGNAFQESRLRFTVLVRTSSQIAPGTAQAGQNVKAAKWLDIHHELEAANRIYTVSCRATAAASDCFPLNPGECLQAELLNNTMWVSAQKGDLRKPVRIRFKVIKEGPK